MISVEKRLSYGLFNMIAYRFFSSKNVQATHQFNNIVETTRLTNDQMPEFHCHCECLKCPLPAPSSNTSLHSLNL